MPERKSLFNCAKPFFFFLLELQNPMGSGLALAISQAAHFLQPPPHQSIIIERMHSGMFCNIPHLQANCSLKIMIITGAALWCCCVFPTFQLSETKQSFSVVNIQFVSISPPRSAPFRHAGLWPPCPADWCSDPNLWGPGLSVHRHLDTGGGDGWPQAGGGHRHQHPLPHSARPTASSCVQVHEGLCSVRMLIWSVLCDRFSHFIQIFRNFYLNVLISLRSQWLGATAVPMLGPRSHWAFIMATLTSCHGRANWSWCTILCVERARQPVSQMLTNTWPWWWRYKRTSSAGQTTRVQCNIQ